jgi:carboxylesterase type B
LGILPALGLASNDEAPTATIDTGVLIGKSTSLPAALGPVNQFLGIPFAQSPPERFSPPQAAVRSSSPINATAWKPACLQQFRCRSSRRKLKNIHTDRDRPTSKLTIYSSDLQ